MIGEIETTGSIKNQIVGSAQCPTVTLGIQISHFASSDIDALNATTTVICLIKRARKTQSAKVKFCKATAVITHVQKSIGTNSGAIWATGHLGDCFFGSVRTDTRNARSKHFHQDNAAIAHRNRTFWKPQTISDFNKFHDTSPLSETSWPANRRS